MDGEVEQLSDDNLSSTVTIEGRRYLPVDRATTRLMPIQTCFVTSYKPDPLPWQAEFSILAVAKADDLILKDETDRTRIPTRGTPSYVLFGLKGGMSGLRILCLLWRWKTLRMKTTAFMDPV